VNDALANQVPAQWVPAGYAEKAMASLMQLHSELMEEKERRVDLFRRLMEREQALAELKMYVKVLEEKLAAAVPPRVEVPSVTPPAPQVPPTPVTPPPAAPPRAASEVGLRPPVPPRVGVRPAQDGWRSW
jgi:hypothetical protein